MPLKLSSVLLRWYRSFNTLPGQDDDSEQWEKLDGKSFRFVRVPIEEKITTVVGANESGKSHLLSAIAKSLSDNHELLPSDICRHCAFNVLDREANPQIGIQFKALNDDNTPVGGLFESLGLPTKYLPKAFIALVQPDVDAYATIYDDQQNLVGYATREKWLEAASEDLPSVEFIEPDKEFTSHIHISQLLAAYSSVKEEAFFDTMPLNEVGRQLLALPVPTKPADAANAEFPEKFVNSVAALKQTLSGCKLAATKHTSLAKDLFKDILEITPEKLGYLKSLNRNMLGYIELFSSDLTERIGQHLDLANYWTQDDDIRLGVDYKDGFFYFEILDRTGKRFTFDERSSGLRFFLSYYIQSLAILKRNQHRKAGCIVMMDEPDRFLSAIAQKNLLQVFDRLTGSNSTAQVIYTTHSPFSINRNFPGRLRLLRKGDGSEGTQVVPNSAARCYEPVRTALGIDSGDTLFFGANNIIVEGISDQKTITVAAQIAASRAGKPTLDLNTLTFLRANGVGQVSRLIERSGVNSKANGERSPITICLLDGDATGLAKIQEIKNESLLPDGTFVTFRDLQLKVEGTEKVVEVLEDLFPIKLLKEATRRYGIEELKFDASKFADYLDKEFIPDKHSNMAKAIEAVVAANVPSGQDISLVRVRSEIVDFLLDRVLQASEFKDELDVFVGKFGVVLNSLNKQLLIADRHYRQRNIQKKCRMLIEPFLKIYQTNCTRFDVGNLLRELSLAAAGNSQEATNSRMNFSNLEELLDEEAIYGSDPVDAGSWRQRFEFISQCPWKEPKNGWRGVGK